MTSAFLTSGGLAILAVTNHGTTIGVNFTAGTRSESFAGGPCIVSGSSWNNIGGPLDPGIVLNDGTAGEAVSRPFVRAEAGINQHTKWQPS